MGEKHTLMCEERSHCTRIGRAEAYTVANLRTYISSDMHETFWSVNIEDYNQG